MNKTFTSIVAVGLGAVAYKMGKENDMFSGRTMKKMRKRMKRAFS